MLFSKNILGYSIPICNFGVMSPALIDNLEIIHAQSYLLANTELNVNGYVRSITIHASTGGSILLQVNF
jgi:hypothetical protein